MNIKSEISAYSNNQQSNINQFQQNSNAQPYNTFNTFPAPSNQTSKIRPGQSSTQMSGINYGLMLNPSPQQSQYLQPPGNPHATPGQSRAEVSGINYGRMLNATPQQSQYSYKGNNSNVVGNQSRSDVSGINYRRMLNATPQQSQYSQAPGNSHHHNFLKSTHSHANQVSGINFNNFGTSGANNETSQGKTRTSQTGSYAPVSGINFGAFQNGQLSPSSQSLLFHIDFFLVDLKIFFFTNFHRIKLFCFKYLGSDYNGRLL